MPDSEQNKGRGVTRDVESLRTDEGAEVTLTQADDSAVVDMAARAKRNKAFRKDTVLMDSVSVAREAALSVARESALGDHAGVRMVGDRLATHRFVCLEAGYPGWFWEVTLGRAPRSKKATVCEIDLAPGPGVELAPPWVPWRDRLQPGDVSRTDVLPYDANDGRLQNGFEEVNPDEVELVGLNDMGHGRKRVLSQHGLDLAADRWYDSPQGAVAGVKPNAMCASCGFLLKMQGTMGTLFGVGGNEWSPDDGRVVSFDHSCGAHSETDQPQQRSQWPLVPSRINDDDVEVGEF